MGQLSLRGIRRSYGAVDVIRGIDVGVFTAMRASEQVRLEYERSGPADLCALAPRVHLARRGRWAPKALPFVFIAMWLLALIGAVGGATLTSCAHRRSPGTKRAWPVFDLLRKPR